MEVIVVPPGESPKKLENFLKKTYPIGYIRKLFRKNGVRVNGRRARPDETVESGHRIEIFIPFSPGSSIRQTPVRRDDVPVIFENRDLLVVNKPAGVAVHEARGMLKRDTLIGLLETRYRSAGVKIRLVHRLDKNTSGVLVTAKSEAAAEALESRFAQAEVEKEYHCLIAGRLQEKGGMIDLRLPGREGRPVRALTRFKTEMRFAETTLVRVIIETGRMHQIRLHFAALGHPVVLDDQHGDFQFNRTFRTRYGLKRQFLHAARLALEYGGAKHNWTAPLAADLQATLDRLRIEANNHA